MSNSPILFIHGFPFDHAMWRHQLAASAHRECFAPDLRGAGAAAAPSDPDQYSMASYARDLIALIDDRQIQQVVLCGLSMGGYIAFELLRQIRERVRAVILCNTKAAPDTPEAKQGRDVLAAKARAKGASAVGAELVPKVLARLTRERQPEVVREVMQMIERQPIAGIVGALHALRERPDSTPVLGTIQVPALVIAGDDDQITPAAGLQEMARAIPGAEFVRIAEAGHLTPLENPAAFNAAVDGFMGRL